MTAAKTVKWPALLITSVSLIMLAACSEEPGSPEEALRDWVRQGEVAVEEKDRGDLLALIAPHYADARGTSREEIGDRLRVIFLRQQKIALLTTIEDLQVFDDTAALITLQVGMAGTNNNLLGFSADAYTFELELELTQGEWLLTSARWSELGDDPR